MFTRTLRQSRPFTLGMFATALALCSGAALAQSESDTAYIAAVTKDGVFVHSGADSRYYPFGTLDAGDLVEVQGEKNGWARVATAGAAFDGMFGYVKYPRSDAGRFRLEADGKTGVTLGMLDLIAPNMSEDYSPEHSWKPIGQKRPVGETLRVLESSETDREVVHKVALSADASGWVSSIHLRRATDAEVAAWKAALGASGRSVETRPQEDEATTQAPKDVQPVTARAMDPVPDINPLPTNEDDATEPEQPADEGAMDAQPTTAPGTETDLDEEEFNRWHERLLDLEDAFKVLKEAPLEAAEVGVLRNQYEDLAKTATDEEESVIARFAERRASQLSLWSELQERKAELARLRQRVQIATEDFDAAKMAIAMSGDYAAVGRLEASLVYNGRSLPELYRVQDEKSGRTIAYMKPDQEFQLAGLLGQMVGVAGEIEYDGSLRVNMLVPRHVDVLVPKKK